MSEVKVDLTKPKHSDTEEYSEETKKQFPRQLNPRHRSLMRYLLAGRNNLECAEILGYSPKRISLIINSPLFKAEMEKMRIDIDKGVVSLESTKAHMDGGVSATLQDQARQSLQKIIDLRDRATSERVQQVSALEILDRAGYSKTEKTKAVVELDVSEGLLNAIKCAMSEMSKPKEVPNGNTNKKGN